MRDQDVLVVGIDLSTGTDKTVMVIGHQENDKTTIINYIRGKEAEDLYQKLTGGNTNA